MTTAAEAVATIKRQNEEAIMSLAKIPRLK